MGLLDVAKLAHERIEDRIGNLRVVEHVVTMSVVFDFPAQRDNALGKGFFT